MYRTKTRKAVTTYVSDKTIEKIIKLLRCAFKQAVRWEIIARNPFDNVILPKTEYAKRDIWTADMIRLALDKCTDSKLYVAMNLSFACSLRMGEILGLTWENVHISDEDILQLRGVRPFFSDKFDIMKHPRYKYLADADKKNSFDIERYMKRRPAIVKPDEPFDLYELNDTDLQPDNSTERKEM